MLLSTCYASCLSCCVARSPLRSFPTRRSSDLQGAVIPVSARCSISRGSLQVGKVPCRPGRAGRRSTWVRHPLRRSEEHTSELQSRGHLVCRRLLEKKQYRDHRSKVTC